LEAIDFTRLWIAILPNEERIAHSNAADAIMPVEPLVRPATITEPGPRADPSNARTRRRVGLSRWS
jgi:hypothetical protein